MHKRADELATGDVIADPSPVPSGSERASRTLMTSHVEVIKNSGHMTTSSTSPVSSGSDGRFDAANGSKPESEYENEMRAQLLKKKRQELLCPYLPRKEDFPQPVEGNLGNGDCKILAHLIVNPLSYGNLPAAASMLSNAGQGEFLGSVVRTDKILQNSQKPGGILPGWTRGNSERTIADGPHAAKDSGEAVPSVLPSRFSNAVARPEGGFMKACGISTHNISNLPMGQCAVVESLPLGTLQTGFTGCVEEIVCNIEEAQTCPSGYLVMFITQWCADAIGGHDLDSYFSSTHESHSVIVCRIIQPYNAYPHVLGGKHLGDQGWMP